MTQRGLAEIVRAEFNDLVIETFEKVDGMYLDRGTSLFETLETISYEEASRPVGSRCACIAAQVNHVRFYIDVLHGYMTNNKPEGKVDWDASWQITSVSDAEWQTLKQELRAAYERVVATTKNFDTWEGEDQFAGAFSIVVHTAYHLGEIRQALCTVQP